MEADDIDIDALPQACVEDTKAHINIQPFGLCQKNDDCTFKMDLDDRWVNAEPQNVRVNGKEIITLYDPDDLEGAYILAALERLLVDHDVRSFEGFMRT